MLFNDGRVVSNFIVQAIRNEPLTLYGEGLQTRSFCYVDDLVEGFIRMMSSEGFVGPVNLGNPNEITVRELAEKIRGYVGSSSEICFKPLPADDPTRRRPDISLAKAKLGWEPKVSLEAGLKRTIDDFSARLKAEEQTAP
jgi:UDP-glucuronate decarboxylase